MRPRLYSPGVAPEVVFVITDDIGSFGAQQAIREARRCGYAHILMAGTRTPYAALERHARETLAAKLEVEIRRAIRAAR